MRSFSAPTAFKSLIVTYALNKDKRTLVLYSNTYFLLVPALRNLFNYGFHAFSSISTRNIVPVNLSQLFYETNFFLFFFLKSVKFSFSGKGHKLKYNKSNTVTFNFGHSHIFYVYNPTTKPLLLTKTKGFFLGLNSFLVKDSALRLQQAKPINTFSGRGVRLTRQLIIKKTGKVSMYM